MKLVNLVNRGQSRLIDTHTWILFYKLVECTLSALSLTDDQCVHFLEYTSQKIMEKKLVTRSCVELCEFLGCIIFVVWRELRQYKDV